MYYTINYINIFMVDQKEGREMSRKKYSNK